MPSAPLSAQDFDRMDAWWRAANYLSVGQVYLLANPLLRQPLKMDDTKPRLLGHWGTVPGLNFIYVHLNRIINARDLNLLFIAGPGHGAPGVVANCYLEGTYSERYPEVPIYLYPAGHGFCNSDRHVYDEASAKKANARTLAFFAQHLA